MDTENSSAEEALAVLYGSDTFGIKTMEKYLSKSAFKKMLATVQRGGKLDMSIADEVAQAMKVWALSKGATHYTHWFQPLSDATAEKHDSFVEPDGKGGMIHRIHELQDALLNGAKIMILHLLMLGRETAKKGSSCFNKIRPLQVERAVNQEILLLGSKRAFHTTRFHTKTTQNTRSMPAHRHHGTQQRRLLVKSLPCI